MTREQITEMVEVGLISPTAAVFEDEEYIDAVVGYTTDGRLVYDYNKMVDCLVKQDDMEEIEAMEWIDYNTVRSLPYIPEAPVIIYMTEE